MKNAGKISLLFTNLDPYNSTAAFSLSCPSDAIWVLPSVVGTCTLCAIMLSIVIGPFFSLLFIFYGGYFSSLPCLTLGTQLTGPFPNGLYYCHFSFLIGHLGPILVSPWLYPWDKHPSLTDAFSWPSWVNLPSWTHKVTKSFLFPFPRHVRIALRSP